MIDLSNFQKEAGLEGVIQPKGASADEAEAKKNSGDAIPREPEKMKLRGHRARITKVAFHPIYT